ncbi:hypothetical protein [Winogradskyella sp.]|uniref:hypothetical protein n=1 Tax=Winogradskyella sp. TaxID=1883156 RepID=UPI003F6C00E2
MKKLLLLSIIFCFSIKINSQADLNQYKYAVIPLQYEFLKGKDKYRLNTLARVLFKGEGFGTFFTEEQLPDDLFKDRCLAIYPDVKKVKGGFFKTKLQIIIKDCNGRVLLESMVGESKENNHQLAHNMALREAFQSIERLNYEYKPLPKMEEVKENKDASEVEKISQKRSEDLDVEVSKEIVKTNEASIQNFTAKVTENGYQLLDKDSNVVMSLYQSAAKNVFIVKDKNAIVFKLNDKWLYSENTGDNQTEKIIEITF